MLYELYKMFYINLYDNLIVVFLFSLIIICKFILFFFFKCVLHFNQARTCTLCLGSKRPLSLSVPALLVFYQHCGNNKESCLQLLIKHLIHHIILIL